MTLILTHIRLCVPFLNWVLSCVSTISFSVLINGAATEFFIPGGGLRQGCPLSPLPFLIVADGLSKVINEAKRSNTLKSVKRGASFEKYKEGGFLLSVSLIAC